AATVVLRRVDEEPTAVLTRALPQRLPGGRSEELSRRMGDTPEHGVWCLAIVPPSIVRSPFPADAALCPAEVPVCLGERDLGIERVQVGTRRRSAPGERGGDTVDRLAQRDAPRKHRGARVRARTTPALRLLGADQAGLMAPAHEIRILQEIVPCVL